MKDLSQSVGFYSKLFGVAPTIEKPDYAKWMLDDAWRPQREIAGVVGIELAGAAALIRSLVVGESLRGAGAGKQLLAAEARAVRLGAHELSLLTATAEKFFAALGCRVIPRTEAPEAIRRLPQFLSLCPATATLMKKP